MNNGLIVINKPSGCTSRDIVNMLCKILHTKSVGHIGTLDPLAEGVLVCLTGKYTKLTNILINHDKEYIAEFKLGMLTDTLDITGKILKEEKYSLNINKLKKILNDYIKTYEQEVPIYSAIKVCGRKLYDYARNNEEVELPKKKVTIYDIELLSVKDELVKIKCHVSKGTYIRSLIRDIGNSLGTYATMTKLTRTKLGNFDINNSYTIDDIEHNKYKSLDIKDFMNIEEVDITKEEDYIHIKNGNIMNVKTNKYILYKYNNLIVALYEPFKDKIKPLIMF